MRTNLIQPEFARFLRLLGLAGLLFGAGAPVVAAQDGALESAGGHSFTVRTLTSGLRRPWSLAFLPDGRMLVTERPGRLWILDQNGAKTTRVSGVPSVAAIGQGGLLDVVLHPDFASNGLIFLSYAEPGVGGAGTAVARAELSGSELTELNVIFRQRPKLLGGRHFGSRLVFLPDGTLLISMGDRAQRRRAQDLGNHQGAIARMTVDGEVPSDNPFAERSDAKPEIYSYGHRNIHGMTRDPVSGIIWAHEYGALGGDELNIVKSGANYGWPTITYSKNYDGSVISPKTTAPDRQQPIAYWTPSISPSGLAIYRGDKFPNWRGDLLVGALTPGHLRLLEIENGKVVGQERLLEKLGDRIRDVRVGPNGLIYVLTDASNGKLIRLEPR